MNIINLHTHIKLAGNQLGLVNHTIQLHFQATPGQLYSIGIHPWDAMDNNESKYLELIENMTALPQVLAIGECGIDRSIETGIDTQLPIFLKQIEIAEKHGLPLIIHAVRSYADLMQIKKERKAPIPWILHGYNGNIETTKQLVNQNFFFSFGASLLKNQEKLNLALQQVPINQLFFETDESTESIESIYIFAASILGLKPEKLQSIILQNFQRVFKK